MLDAEVEERGLPLHYPHIARAAAAEPVSDADRPEASVQERTLPATGSGTSVVAFALAVLGTAVAVRAR